MPGHPERGIRQDRAKRRHVPGDGVEGVNILVLKMKKAFNQKF